MGYRLTEDSSSGYVAHGPDGEVLSTHREEREAVESCLNAGGGYYTHESSTRVEVPAQPEPEPDPEPTPEPDPEPTPTPTPTPDVTITVGDEAATVEGAIELADTHTGKDVLVVVPAGTYRETINMTNLPNAGGWATLTVEGDTSDPGNVVVSGGEVYSSWTRDQGDTYYTTGSFTSGWLTPPGGTNYNDDGSLEFPIRHRLEVVVVDGVLLRQYLTLWECRNNEGSYYHDDDTGRMYVHTSGGPSGKTVEIGERDYWLRAKNASDVTIRGMTFEIAANDFSGDKALRIKEADNWTFEDCVIQFANAQAFTFTGNKVRTPTVFASGLKMLRVTVKDNGIAGMNHRVCHDVTITDCTFIGGGWRATGWRSERDEGAGYGQGYMSNSGGDKQLTTRNWTITDCTWQGYYGPALWFDYDCQDITVTRCGWYDGYHWDVFLERSIGPFTFQGCEWFDGTIAVNIADVDDVTFENAPTGEETRFSNFYHGILQVLREHGQDTSNPDYVYTSEHDGVRKNANDRNHSWTDCVFYVNTDSSVNWRGHAVIGSAKTDSTWDDWVNALGTVDRNTYYRNPDNDQQTAQDIIQDSPAGNVRYFSLAEWQAESGEDSNSTSPTGSPLTRRYV